MSDEDTVEEMSDSGDFSASEDEWKPDGEKPTSSENESEQEEDAFETSSQNKRNRSTKKMTKNSSRKSQSLRTRMFNKYKPPPKSVNSPSSSQLKNLDLSRVLESSRYKKKKSISSSQNTDDSDSSGDDYLVDPKDIDLKSSFFDAPTKISEEEQPPDFDCNAGLRLSDSEEEEEDFQEVQKEVDAQRPNTSAHLKEEHSLPNESSFKHLHDYALKMESAKEHLKSFKSESVKEEDVDVSKLLAIGEAKVVKSEEVTSKKRKKGADSDSDWEEVQDMKSHLNVTKEGIQVTVQLQQDKSKEKKTLDVEAMLKRKLNRIIKENQLCFHKVSLLCHIAHGIYCNKALNNPTLMAQALKLLPNKTCYPNGRTEIKYFESMAKWYKTAVALKSDKMYSYFRTRPPLPISLAIQIKYKAAICKKDFVLIFITLLRAMGIQCRMVMNLVPLPIKPAQSDLCKITMKKENKSENKVTTKIKKDTKKVSHTVLKSHSTSKEKKATKEKSGIELKKEIKNKELSKDTIKDEQKNSSQKQSVNKEAKNDKKVSNRSRKKQKLEDPKENDQSTQEKTKKTTEKTKKTVSNSGKNVESSSSNENKLLEKPVKKLARKVAENKGTQETHISPHFTKRDSNSKEDGKTEKIILSNASGRSLRSKTKQQLEELAVKIPQLDGADNAEDKQTKSSRGRNIKLKFPKKHPDPPTDSEDEFVPSPPKKPRPSASKTKAGKQVKRDRRVLSTDEDDNTARERKGKKDGMDIWVEVFAEAEDEWITIDLFSGKVHCVDTIRKAATSPIAYVFAWNNDNTLKDVSPRYCSQWHTVTRKLRVEQEWLDVALRNYVIRHKSARDKKEDRELHKIHMEKPLPTTISEYKNHPLYVLERHLLKFEAIYPPNALTLGFVRGEPVYARECVHTLHSREIWLKQARVVKLGEKPYKIVKARPKWDKLTNTVIKDQPLEIFGYWQTKKYEPPTAENGIVPRNAYGNVELFKKCMLPKKTVHIQLPGLNKICKKLNIDCAPAVVGFDFHQGMCHPLLDGFVVCEEFADQVVAAWYKEQEEVERREEEKYQQRVYGNWKKLIKGVLIREKLKMKYNFEGVKYEEKEKLKRKKK